MLNEKLKKYNIILASRSPRRQSLLRELGICFEVRLKEEKEEIFPDGMEKGLIAEFLARQKAKAYITGLNDNDLLITADTIVWINGKVLNKPSCPEEAAEMLRELSGKAHSVLTGVCISSRQKTISFTSETDVFFKTLSDEEIQFYVENYKPYDKAGAYGIQEWIGYIGINRINGSYFNVMGLPVQSLYDELLKF